jgi:hypothetical protein
MKGLLCTRLTKTSIQVLCLGPCGRQQTTIAHTLTALIRRMSLSPRLRQVYHFAPGGIATWFDLILSALAPADIHPSASCMLDLAIGLIMAEQCFVLLSTRSAFQLWVVLLRTSKTSSPLSFVREECALGLLIVSIFCAVVCQLVVDMRMYRNDTILP